MEEYVIIQCCPRIVDVFKFVHSVNGPKLTRFFGVNVEENWLHVENTRNILIEKLFHNFPLLLTFYSPTFIPLQTLSTITQMLFTRHLMCTKFQTIICNVNSFKFISLNVCLTINLFLTR